MVTPEVSAAAATQTPSSSSPAACAQLVARPCSTAHVGEVLPDVVALDPTALRQWSARQRWGEPCRQVDPRLPRDAHYLALAAALDRMAAAGLDVAQALIDAVSPDGHGPLPERHPGRTLHERLAGKSEAAVAPAPLPGCGGLSAPSAGPLETRPAITRSPPRR